MYRKFFDILGINFLHNDLLYMESTEYRWKRKILHEEEILKMGESKLREKVLNSAVSILGGIGFSGLNKEFNALQINYGKSFDGLSEVEALQKDTQESDRFNAIYKKLLKTSDKNRVIVLTHDDCKLMADNYLRFERESSQNLPSIRYSNNSKEFRNKDYIFDVGEYIKE